MTRARPQPRGEEAAALYAAAGRAGRADPQTAYSAPAAPPAGRCACGDPAVLHDLDDGGQRTRCTVSTAAGPCGCTGYTPAAGLKEPPDGT